MELILVILIILMVFNTVLLLGAASMLLKMADHINKQKVEVQEKEEEEETLPLIKEDMTKYNPYNKSVGKLDRGY